jgi:hypothetical protein
MDSTQKYARDKRRKDAPHICNVLQPVDPSRLQEGNFIDHELRTIAN